MKLKGSIVKFGARRSASGDKVKTLTLEVFGSFEEIDRLMEKPLTIEILEEGKTE